MITQSLDQTTDRTGRVNFFYLNQDSRWPDFQWRGLELDEDGILRLSSLPSLTSPTQITHAAPDAPLGVAQAPDGTLYFTRPNDSRLWRIDPCDPEQQPLSCIGTAGDQPTQFRQPRGVLFHRQRQSIFVVDSGNHRIQIFHPKSFQLVGIWGQPDAISEPDTAAGRFNTPWTLAEDAAGNVYVVDYGNQRVQKFDLSGNVMPQFWNTARTQTTWLQPRDIAIAQRHDQTEIYVLADLDAGEVTEPQVVVLDAEGHLLRSFGAGVLQDPMGIAATGRAVLVGDNQRRRLLKFALEQSAPASEREVLIGEAQGYEGTIAALAIAPLSHDSVQGDTKQFPLWGNHLWLHSGGDSLPLSLPLDQAFGRNGILWGGPFHPREKPVKWHRFKATGSVPAAGGHFQVFVYLSDRPNPPPSPTLVNPLHPFDSEAWQPLPVDGLDALIPGNPATYLWIGAHFTSEGNASPTLEQIKLQFDYVTYSQHLPAIYQETQHRDTLERLLALFESSFTETEALIASLGEYIDPEAAPADWLPWLAGWLALMVDENTPAEQQRRAIAQAPALQAQRGTVRGLQAALRFYAQVEARIEEPILQTTWWALAADEASTESERQTSLLGFTTRLPPAEAQGAVVGTTATLDQSHLIRQEEFGSPLFEEMAHQFSVQIYQAQIRTEADLDRIRAVIDREKPIHTTYQISLIAPQMRVGFQSRVGIDTVVAGQPLPTRLESAAAQTGLILDGEPPGEIGNSSQIGRTTRLS